MSKLNWSTMSPRERDALVATEVMGWNRREGTGEKDMFRATQFGSTSAFPNYTSSIAAAWEVVETMNKTWFVMVERISNHVSPDGRWHCEMGGYHANESTAPEAICLSALKAVGVDV